MGIHIVILQGGLWSDGVYSSRIKQDRQCTHNVTEAHWCKHFCLGKAMSITYSECVFSLN